MKLIFIYGPPAVGKYTVAQAIAEKTGYPLFHNHLTVDLLKTIIPFDSPEFHHTIEKIRLTIFEAAAASNIPGLIFTFVYEKTTDDDFVKQVIDCITSRAGEVMVIQLSCSPKQLKERVVEPSRLAHRKLNSVDGLEKALQQYNLLDSIEGVNNHHIDTTGLTTTESIARALKVIETNDHK